MRSFVLLFALAMLSCSPSEKSADANSEIANKLFEAFNKHDWKAMAELYADSAMFLDPSFGKDFVKQSRAQTMMKYGDLQKIFPDIKDNVIGIYSSGDKVVAEFVSTGSSDQGFSLKLPIVSVLTIKEGKIVRDATYYDLENP